MVVSGEGVRALLLVGCEQASPVSLGQDGFYRSYIPNDAEAKLRSLRLFTHEIPSAEAEGMKLGDEKKGDVNRCSPRFSANFFFL